MKIINYKKRRKALSLIVAYTVLLNMTFLPPFLAEEKFSPNRIESFKSKKKNLKKIKLNLEKQQLLNEREKMKNIKQYGSSRIFKK